MLAGLTNLSWLTLYGNVVSDISVLAGLTEMGYLSLDGNVISDISALSGLINLSWLYLSDNNISDISSLVANTGWGEGNVISVKGNPLSYQSIHTHIPALQSRGVTVEFDNQAHPALLKISGDNQTGAPDATLANPFGVEAQDENGAPLAGVAVAFTITGGGGTLSIANTTTDANGRAESTLTLGADAGINTVAVAADGIAVAVTFYANAAIEPPPITADANGDGTVNLLDLVLVGANLGQTGQNPADVNGDGVVNIHDLTLVAGALSSTPAAPAIRTQTLENVQRGRC